MNRNGSLVLCFILWLVLPGCSGHESDQDAIKKTIAKYDKYATHEDFNKLVNMLHPDAFKNVSRKQLAQDMNYSYHNPDFDMNMHDMAIDSTSAVILSGTNKYALVKTHATASLLMRIMPSFRNIDSIATVRCNELKKIYGESKVTCKVKERKFDVIVPGNYYVIYESQYKKWFILEQFDPASAEGIIPESIVKQLAQ